MRTTILKVEARLRFYRSMAKENAPADDADQRRKDSVICENLRVQRDKKKLPQMTRINAEVFLLSAKISEISGNTNAPADGADERRSVSIICENQRIQRA